MSDSFCIFKQKNYIFDQKKKTKQKNYIKRGKPINQGWNMIREFIPLTNVLLQIKRINI